MSFSEVCLAFKSGKEERSWCDCSSETACKYLGDKLQCNCGEEWQTYEWNWEEDSTAKNVQLSNNNRDVVFHPVYSSGTAAVRGNQQLKQNMHYYWEIKMLTNLYGTDIMLGIGTSKVVLSDWKIHFGSILGSNRESWGYSYRGNVQHSKISFKYGPRYSIGSLVGIHVDMCAGTLEYYLNRRPLGIAFRGLKGLELYPMACSTAAQSAMRITCAVSEVPTLQMECIKIIKKNSKLLQQYWDIPGLARRIKHRFFWMAPKPAEETGCLDLEDAVVLPAEYLDRNFIRRKRFCPGLLKFTDPRTDPDHFVYRQILSAKEKCHIEILKLARAKEELENKDSDKVCENETNIYDDVAPNEE